MKSWQSSAPTAKLEESLKLYRNVPIPTAAALSTSQLIVKVICASINPIDIKLAEMGPVSRLAIRGAYSPGLDFCGHVVSTHPSVSKSRSDLKEGTLVFGVLPFPPTPTAGTLSQYIVASADSCAAVPAGVSPDDAAAIASAGLTALGSLAGVKPGMRVLINGGSGGVGTFAVQMAKALGAVHVTVTCSEVNVELCRRLGADKVLDYRSHDVIEELKGEENMYDVIVDNVGNAELKLYENSAKYLKKAGVFVQVGGPMSFSNFLLIAKRMYAPVCLGGGNRTYKFQITKIQTKDLEKVVGWLTKKKVRAVIDQTYELEEVPKAYEKLRQGRSRGKIVVHVN
ncbi:NAD(P)-binding protein [Corynespora cassiicola Philippines]|uniref:NAD(P)-binding protein n=1 Tax=Corynespora cassiicola Philippines TaxID=1448308 RepID=A0A2T2NJX3_CORCC|nr:NAD(P)-binding protein [Corynespora cassiicola Philippines]